ncbi:MAG TPA: hypothetical protein VFG54_09445, partial [Prolixibacteraceae bacterium]|nr:hypothetical protein [Prolixibacteraceae bacterium]
STKLYYDALRIESEIKEAAIHCYLPSNDFLLRLIKQSKKQLKLGFYISSTASDQFLMYEPEVLKSFSSVADTNQADFLGGTFSHSLVTLTNNKNELISQVRDHQSKTKFLFGVRPQVFVNSDLMYSDLIGKDIADAGYRAMITNGAPKTLEWRSPNYVYSNIYRPDLNVYFRNERISDSLAEQLMNLHSEKDIDTDEIFHLISDIPEDEPLLIIYLDYKVLGGLGMILKHQFMEELITRIQQSEKMQFILPHQIADHYGPVAPITAMEPICWVNGFSSNYYPGNELQVEAIKQIYLLQPLVENVDDLNLQKDWQYLQTSDIIHLMDDQHPMYREANENRIYNTRYDAYANFMNILDDFRLKLHKATGLKEKSLSGRPSRTGSSKGKRVTGTNKFHNKE